MLNKLHLGYFNLKVRLYKRCWSKAVRISGKPHLNQPLLINGEGTVVFDESVHIGYSDSPGFYSSYTYFDLRGDHARISLGKNVQINNNGNLTADHASIIIGQNTLIGVNFSIQTSDGHNLDPKTRTQAIKLTQSVEIGENVFIGDNVTLLKGITIGANAVIGAGSVVTKSIPAQVVAAGNPCRVIRSLE
jgi:acetyltransferase-like isoleucine patch superfamily enzyme